jgi:hypothetical protein
MPVLRGRSCAHGVRNDRPKKISRGGIKSHFKLVRPKQWGKSPAALTSSPRPPLQAVHGYLYSRKPNPPSLPHVRSSSLVMKLITSIGSAVSVALALAAHASTLVYIVLGAAYVTYVMWLLPDWLRKVIATGDDLLQFIEHYRRLPRHEQRPRRSARTRPAHRSVRGRRRALTRARQHRSSAHRAGSAALMAERRSIGARAAGTARRRVERGRRRRYFPWFR